MLGRNAAACVLVACAACARPAAPPAAPPRVEEPSTPTPFLPRGFTGVAPAAPAAASEVPTGTESAAALPGFDLDQAAHGVNLFRAVEELAELRSQDDLNRLAQERAAVLARNGTLRHPADAAATLAALGYHGRLAAHAISVRSDLEDPVGAALQALLTDPAHRANLLDPTFRHLGQGAASDGEWWYLVQVLAEHGPDG